MDADFKKRKKEGRLSFKLYGVLSCKRCANKWKISLMNKGKKVRIIKGVKGWEVWTT